MHNAFTTDFCRILSILRMWPIQWVVPEVLGFLSWRCITTTHNYEAVIAASSALFVCSVH